MKDIDVSIPNGETAAAFRELEEGKGERFKSIKDLMVDLNANN